MPSHPQIPPLLSQYISNFPSGCLALLTSTLGATTNWLVLRFIHAALKDIGHGGPNVVSRNTRVVLVSWLRDANFWKDGGRKLSVNIQKLEVVDALSQGLGLGVGGLVEVEKEVLKVIGSVREATKDDGRVLLVLDGLDFLLAATACPTLDAINMAGELREHVVSTIITSCADLALTQGPTTPLEVSHAAFLVSMAHQASIVMSLKGLDTGVAKDISGVLRISRGASAGCEDEDVEDKECLYFVEPDGGVKVFERGA